MAIGVGGLTAGALDLTQACILFGWKIPLSIAAGLLGRTAFRGGVGTYLLGVFLHFFIAFSFAATYYAASRPLEFLKEHPLVCGLFYGAAVELVMSLVVLPLSALHARGPYQAVRLDSRSGRPHGRDRAADCLQRPAVRDIDVSTLRGNRGGSSDVEPN